MEISFEKDIWFSEEINIRKGHNLIEKFASVNEFAENWDGIDDYYAECTREVEYIE